MHRRAKSRRLLARPTGHGVRRVIPRWAAVIAAALVAAIAPVGSVMMKEAEAAVILEAITLGTALVPPGAGMTLGVAGAGMILGDAGSDCSATTPCWPAFGSGSSATVATLTDGAGAKLMSKDGLKILSRYLKHPVMPFGTNARDGTRWLVPAHVRRAVLAVEPRAFFYAYVADGKLQSLEASIDGTLPELEGLDPPVPKVEKHLGNSLLTVWRRRGLLLMLKQHGVSDKKAETVASLLGTDGQKSACVPLSPVLGAVPHQIGVMRARSV